jgi:glutamine synthetase
MEFMKRIASKHGLACLLHEKPFAGVNGSGKHNNWSIATAEGENLLTPGKEPQNNTRFLLFLAAIIKAVDDYQDLLRVSVASAGNDHRLGANEAPPAIVSVFLGSELTSILEAVEKDAEYNANAVSIMQLNGNVIPHFAKDTTDRNRTSPFAFTGNKFEFRMPGSSFSISGPNIVLNTIVAEVLEQFADELESQKYKEAAIKKLIRETVAAHKRIIFNGDGYTDEWVEEAEMRGLLNLKSTPEAIPYMLDKKNIELFTKHRIFTEAEIHSRVEILLEGYAKTIRIEALTLGEMMTKDLLPAAAAFSSDLAATIANKKLAGLEAEGTYELAALKRISTLSSALCESLKKLEKALAAADEISGAKEIACHYRDAVFAAMQEIRETADKIEPLLSEKYLPYPTYGQLLFGVN